VTDEELRGRAQLARGRQAAARQDWAIAYRHLSSAAAAADLDLTDLELLAVAAQLLGRDDDGLDVWAQAHREAVRRGDAARAARCAFWLAIGFLNRGDVGHGTGWLARGGDLLERHGRDCVEHGYLLVPVALGCLVAGDVEQAMTTFARAAEVAEHFDDGDLATLAKLGMGQALVRSGDFRKGIERLDEAMVGVIADEVSPIVVGIVYCGVIEACQDAFEVRRAREWTEALTGWCDAHPNVVPFRGECLAYRAELMRLSGAWRDALEEAQRASEVLARPGGQRALGRVYYQLGELRRLRGQDAQAEEAYRLAHRHGRNPHPGLALLRLGQGRVADAHAAIRNSIDGTPDSASRGRLLPAIVEIMLASSDVQGARAAANELSQLAADQGIPLLSALAAQSEGAVLLAEGHAQAALGVLRRALAAWQESAMPYEAARTRVLVGLASRGLGDADTAQLEFDAARHTFADLGATAELTRLQARLSGAAAPHAGGLSGREMEVLRLVAQGMTNRAIAADLGISERTVARHVSNILTKLGLPSRSAATAWAYEQAVL
jgi:DNA-binding NarL/FixJ family response regulator